MTDVTKYVKDSAWHMIEHDVPGPASTESKDKQRRVLFTNVMVRRFVYTYCVYCVARLKEFLLLSEFLLFFYLEHGSARV